MPAKRAQDPEPEVAPDTPPPTEPETPASVEASVDEVPAGRLPAGVYEFTGSVPTQYLEIPLTARPASEGRPATDTEPEVPASPATVFDWPFSAPDDGRWKPTRKKPNQQPDNAPADDPEGE